MNTKLSLLTMSGIVSIALSVVFITPKSVVNPKALAFANDKERNEKEEIKGAVEHNMKMRANQITKTIDPQDINSAIAEIREMQVSSNKKTRAFQTIKWQECGPNNIGGRTRALLSDKNTPGKLFMGGVNGGLFVSMDNGGSWSKISGNDTAFGLSVSSICQAANGDIYFGTGEGHYLASGQFGTGQLGTGIYKSTDGGATFQRLPATIPANVNNASTWSYINQMVAHPTDPNKIFATTNGGLYATSNGGTTWAKPTGLTASGLFMDVTISSDGNRVLAASANAVYVSNDGGASFGSNIMGANGLVVGSGIGRIDVTIAPSNKDFVYAVTVSGSTEKLEGVYKSVDGGVNWTKILAGGSAAGASDVLGTQGGYDLAFGVNPVNPELIYLGGQLHLFRYTPGSGANDGWVAIAYANTGWPPNYIHADMHRIEFNHFNPEEMYVTCDGGFFRTTNASDLSPIFSEKNKNYNTLQPYGISANFLGHIIYGSQDNGSGILGVEPNSELTSRKLTGGDGTRNIMSDLEPNIVFTSIINGELLRAGDGGVNSASFSSIFDQNIDSLTPGLSGNNPDDLPDDGAQWVTPIDMKERRIDGVAKGTLVLGTNTSVWMTQDALGLNPKWFRLTTNIGNVGFSAITLSKDGNTVFAGTQAGQVYRIKLPNVWTNKYKYADTVLNIGATYPLKSQIEVTLLQNFSRFVTDVECDSTGNNLVITLGNYGNTNYVYRSSDAQAVTPTITNITNALPKMPVFSAIMVGGNPTKIILGTEFGIWGSDNSGATWAELNSMDKTDPSTWHPRNAVYEIIQKPMVYTNDNIGNNQAYFGSVIFTGTHGRGVFRTNSLGTLGTTTPVGTKNISTIIETLDVYPNPTKNDLNINFATETAQQTVITIYSLTGVPMQRVNMNAKTGNNTFTLDVSRLTPGGYLVSLQSGNRKAGVSFIKQ